MTKHTIGPWIIGDENNEWCEVIVSQHHNIVVQLDRHNKNTLQQVIDREEMFANAHLIAAAPELLDGGEAQTAIIREAQGILTEYLIPNGLTADRAIMALLALLDGPNQRSAQSKWDAAIAKARGEV